MASCPWGFGVLWDQSSDDITDLITFWAMKGPCLWALAGERPQEPNLGKGISGVAAVESAWLMPSDREFKEKAL